MVIAWNERGERADELLGVVTQGVAGVAGAALPARWSPLPVAHVPFDSRTKQSPTHTHAHGRDVSIVREMIAFRRVHTCLSDGPGKIK